MGRGNVCVRGPYEGLYYIDNDHIHVYRCSDDYSDYPETRLMGELDYEELTSGEWLYDEEGTVNEQEDIEECIIADFTAMFHSFRRPEKETWFDRDTRVLLESKLFVIGLVDNEWSMAVELLQKEEPWGDIWMKNLQKIHYQGYLEGLKKVLLGRLPSIGTYKGAWTSGVLTREEAMAQ